jgi:hypothetical protein
MWVGRHVASGADDWGLVALADRQLLGIERQRVDRLGRERHELVANDDVSDEVRGVGAEDPDATRQD